MKKILIISLCIMSINVIKAQNKLNADVQKSVLEWTGEKVLGKHTGTVRLKTGYLIWEKNRIVSGEFTVDMNTIKDNDGLVRLEEHLKSDDFFSVSKYPESKLIITGSGEFTNETATVRGNLTIKGITHPLEFTARLETKNGEMWFYSDIVVDRTKYNVRYGSGKFFQNLGDRLIYDEFKIKVSLLVK